MSDRHLEATELLNKLQRDEAIGEALVTAYRGRHDVVEALARRAAGGSAAPDGLRCERRDLELLAFSRQEGDAPLVQVTDEMSGRRVLTSARRADLHRFLMDLDQDERDLDEAVWAVLKVASEISTGDPVHRSRKAVAEGSRRRRVRTVAELGSTAIIVLGLGAAGVHALTPRSALDLFDRAPSAADPAPPAGLSSAYGVADVRYVDTVLDWDAFVALADNDDVCLLIVRDGLGAAHCIPEKEFQRSGVELETFLSDEHYRTTGDWMRQVIFELSPTGEVHAQVADGPASRT